MNTKPKLSLSNNLKKRRIGLLILAVLIFAVIFIIAQVLISLFIIQMEIVISDSRLQISDEPDTNYKQLIVDVVLYNPGGRRRVTVWVEIINNDTNVSFSKNKSIQIEYKQSEKVTIEFTVDKNIYPGQFDHRVWLTYSDLED
jgi:hypothetical protein